ncbi:ABC transporter ATP-binding protein [Haloplasma contractile]|uniref:ABC transporter ATP-binding protein n=1 Tax=Haloplasma contractile SSD-17B TaxID=1033810 RepID=U2EB06_9MOLU|nr:ABC transporter ATP-binding protein [Haloplasma contractile]ERJ11981.1 ABC transporter ATP-binding protein [Haloplasma contractile SSD-17B]
MIKTKNLTRVYETINYNVVALSNLNFEFEKGEVVVVLGRSGSGKSTFLNILGGFDHDYSGSYYFDDYEFKSMEDGLVDELRSKKIGFIFQHQVLFNNLTVVENVEMALNVLGVGNNRKKRLNAMKALTLVGLRRHALKKPWQLSGGEKQRVAIARAIVKDPDVIICDEPTAALDSVTSKEILDLLASVCKNKLLIIATHNKSIVKNYGTRLLELKSGYVVRDELIKEDKSNIELDELDKLVDETIYEEEYEDYLSSNVNETKDTSNDSKILTDLNLSGYKNRKEETFIIDENEKGEVLKRRREKVKKDEQFDSFDGFNQSMTNIKRYAMSSLLSQKRIYMFFAFFLVSFMLVMIIGLNLSSRILLKTDNTQEINMQIFEQNKLIKFSETNKTNLLLEGYDYEQPLRLSDDLKDDFTTNTNLDYHSKKENPVIINDSSFLFNYHSELFNEIGQYLDENGYENYYSQYYDLNNVVIGKRNTDVIFNDLQMDYTPYKVENPLIVKKIADQITDVQISYMYIENNTSLIEDKLIGHSVVPKRDDEVLVSFKTLIDYGVVNDSSTNIKKLYKQFNALEEHKKVIELETPLITITEDAEGNLVTTETVQMKQFKIVGLYHASEQIESFFKYPEHNMMFFSKEAASFLNINLANEISNETYDLRLIPLYMELNKSIYNEKSIDTVIDQKQQEILSTYYKGINTKLEELKVPIQTSLKLIKNDIDKGDYLSVNGLVGSSYYVNLSHKDVLNEYMARYLEVLDHNELSDLCNNCVSQDQSLGQIKQSLPSLLTKLNRNSETYQKMVDSMGANKSLITEQTINSIIYDHYYERFNNTYYSIYKHNQVASYNELALTYENALEKSSYYNLSTTARKLINEQTPLTIAEDSDGFNHVIMAMGKLIIDHNMITTVMATVASSALIIVLLYVLAYMVAKLFGNIYQLFFMNRQKEFISLKILGAKFEDIKRIIKLEGNLFVVITYGFVLFLLVLFHVLMYATRHSNSFMMYLYEASTEMFININIFDFVGINIITLLNGLILMKLLFKKQLIDNNIDRKFKSIDSIDSITDWDGE